ELLFRQGLNAHVAEIIDPQQATLSVATCGFLRSTEDMLPGQKLFINIPGSLILDGVPQALPRNRIVVEILEHEELTSQLLGAISELKEQGFSFAIDDYTGDPDLDPLLPLASMIKVDLLGVKPEMLPGIVNKLRRYEVFLVAEKVEDARTFNRCKKLGFELFQGYFFARPENLESRRAPAASAVKLRILKKLEEDLEIDELAELVSTDPSLAYRLLRFMNSSAFTFMQEITSVHHAVRLVGLPQVKHWLRLVIVAGLKDKDASPELLMMSITRAKYLELLASEPDRESFFMLGLLSLMDVIMQLPMQEVLRHVPLEQHLADAMAENAGPLHDYLESARALERADWSAVDQLTQRLGLDPALVQRSYDQAMFWATTIFKEVA
ncbi:MAG: EAL and HDOD domain-containing protein, partial [Oceanidesulfovibrio sp.]